MPELKDYHHFALRSRNTSIQPNPILPADFQQHPPPAREV